MVKGRKSGNTKASSPCRQNRMLCSLNHCKDITVRGYTQLKSFLLPMGPGKSTSISVKYNKTTNTSTFSQAIPCHLYEGISTIVHLLLSLLVSLRNEVLQSSLQSSLLVSLQSTSVLASPLTSIWNIFLRSLYEDIFTIIRIQVKPETHSYNHLYKDISTVTPIHIKPERTRSWLPSHSSLQPYMKYFHKLITYYMIDYNHSNNNGNIRRQVVGYMMSLKRK